MHIHTHPVTGEQFHVGGRTRPLRRPKFNLADYLRPKATLPTPPTDFDWTLKAQDALARVYNNDRRGCCVPAGIAHLEGIWTGNADTVQGGLQFDDTQILDPMYKLMGGFDPNNPDTTDNGCDEQTAMLVAQNVGLPVTPGMAPSKILGHIAVDASNWDHVCLAAWLFEGLLTASELPDNAMRNIPASSGASWDMSGQANPGNGHCMVLGAVLNSQGTVKLATWGKVLLVTRTDVQAGMVASNGGELYALLSPDVIARASQKAPTQLDAAQLQADLLTLC